jgi:hypothetical protein
MSNKTQLQTNNTKYASLIETLRGKAAGSSGASIETCTLTIKSLFGSIAYIATCFINGENVVRFENINFATSNNTTVTIDNVISGSAIYIRTVGYVMPAYSVTGGATCLECAKNGKNNWVFSAPTEESGTITVWEDD